MDQFNLRNYLYNNELLNESKEGEVREKWPTLSDDQKIDLLTAIWDDSDMAEKYFERNFEDLPEVAKANMRMDMLREEDDTGRVNGDYDEDPIEENPPTNKEVLFSLKNMKQAYDYGHYIGRTYKFNTEEKKKGFKDLLRSYDPPIVDTIQEDLDDTGRVNGDYDQSHSQVLSLVEEAWQDGLRTGQTTTGLDNYKIKWEEFKNREGLR